MKPKNWQELPELLLTNLLKAVDLGCPYEETKEDVIQDIVHGYSGHAFVEYYRPAIQKYWDALTEEEFQTVLDSTRGYYMQQLEQLEEY